MDEQQLAPICPKGNIQLFDNILNRTTHLLIETLLFGTASFCVENFTNFTF
jgi:hypothetical protein